MDDTFLVDTDASERLKTLSVGATFDDADLDIRPHPNLARDRTFREHMVHQCLSEDMRRGAEDSARRLELLGQKEERPCSRPRSSSRRCAARCSRGPRSTSIWSSIRRA